MKEFFSKIDQLMKASLPYTALLAVILGFINLNLIKKAQSDIDSTYSRVDEIESAVLNNNNTDYVISNIEDAYCQIIDRIDDAEDNLRSNIMIWGH